VRGERGSERTQEEVRGGKREKRLEKIILELIQPH